MLYEFVTIPSSGTIGAHGNLVFLDQSESDRGGSWYYTYTNPPYLVSTQRQPS